MMDKANDAKFVFKFGPNLRMITLPFFSFKRIIIFIFFPFFLIAATKNQVFHESDIKIVTKKFMEHHIEHKELNINLLNRVFKLYVDNFDPERIYLLKEEVSNYLEDNSLNMNNILAKINRQDYTDFYKLNDIFYKAILRAQKIRKQLRNNLELNLQSFSKNVDFAASDKKLMNNWSNLFAYFYNIHNKRAPIDTIGKKQKVFDLLEKRLQGIEIEYDLTQESIKISHNFVLHFLKAFAKSLDAHTYFFSSEEAADMRMNLEKQFEGIGIVLNETVDGVMIVNLVEGSPAKKNGTIKINDIIVEVNGKNIERYSYKLVLNALQERKNGFITLGLKRNGQKNLVHVSLKSEQINMEEERIITSSENYKDGILGCITLKSFYENNDKISSEKDIKEAIDNLRKKGSLKGLILDLRDNSGGFLSQAIRVAGLFISNGIVVISKASKDDMKYIRTFSGTAYYNGPLIVLTSKMSASASEIVAGALQDYGVALIIGDERTFGKGSIQYQTVTNETSDFFYKVTVGRYYTVSGRSPQLKGIKSDIIVPSVYGPYEVGEKYLRYALPSDKVKSAFVDSLEDIQANLKRIFQLNYLPDLQKVVTIWRQAMPQLKEKSHSRLYHDAYFKPYINYQNNKLGLGESRENFSQESSISEDYQLRETINILKDMVELKAFLLKNSEAK